MRQADFEQIRERMVSEQIAGRGIRQNDILNAFKKVQRHYFVPKDLLKSAYSDQPLPIGWEQTISQPYMVALMTQKLELAPGMKVLEIGTGSGYQTAILSVLGAKVYSIERIKALADKAQELLNSLGYSVEVKVADGSLGWPNEAPYDRIIVTAAADSRPKALIDQVKVGGKLIIPLGGRLIQELTVLDKVSDQEVKEEKICSCIFVPLIGKQGYEN